MSIFNPPNGNLVNFDLIDYTPPLGNLVDFDLLQDDEGPPGTTRMLMSILVNGLFRDITQEYISINESQKQIIDVKIMVNGVWKDVARA